MDLSVDVRVQQGAFSLSSTFDFSGSALGLFGPSGSGKTTLIRILSGLVKPDEGYLELNGETLFDSKKNVWVPAHHRRVGVVFQDARLFPHWSAEQNLRAGMAREEEGLFSFEHIVSLLELQPLLRRDTRQLSGGESQRVALGRALLAHPRLLLMDEPVSGIDAEMKGQILPFLKRVHKELHLPCLMVSHYLPDILQLTDSMVLIRKGQTSPPAPLDELVANRAHFEMLRRSGLMSPLALHVDGKLCQVGVRPDEVMLAVQPVFGLSAQHVVKGTLLNLVDHGKTILCFIETPAGLLMADVTPFAVAQLGLKEGREVWSVFKTHAVHTLDEGSGREDCWHDTCKASGEVSF